MRNHSFFTQRSPSSKRRCLLAIALCLALGFNSGELSAEREPKSEVVVIVNSNNATGALSKEFLRRAFLKQVTRWQDDETIRPVDLASRSPTRKQFSESALGRSVEAVKSYWHQRVFSGRDVPPPELPTEEAVVRYVKEHQGAVGYVSAGVDLQTTRVVAVIK